MYCNASSFFNFFQLPKLAPTDVICTIGKTRKIRNIDENSLVINSLKQTLWPIIFYPETLQKSIICYTGYNPVPGFVVLQACNFIKKETPAQMFSCKYCKIFKNSFFIEHLRCLLLHWLKKCFVQRMQNILRRSKIHELSQQNYHLRCLIGSWITCSKATLVFWFYEIDHFRKLTGTPSVKQRRI